MIKKYVTLDFEFKNVTEKDYDLVCVCYTLNREGHTSEGSFWLYRSDAAKYNFGAFFNTLIRENYILLAWSATAELKCLLGLGVDIDSLTVIDAQVEFKLYANCDQFRLWRNESEMKARARAKVQGKTFKKSNGNFSLDVAYTVLFRETYEEKKDMQKMIVTTPEYTEEQKNDILLYCAKDVRITNDIYLKIRNLMLSRYAKLRDLYDIHAMRRGEYVKACCWIEYFGYPVDRVILKKISDNALIIEEEFIREYSQDVIDCFIRDVTLTKRVPNPEWEEGKKVSKTVMKEMVLRENRFSNEVFAEKLEEFGLAKNWPVSPKMQEKYDTKGNGKRAFKVDEDTLEERKGLHSFISDLVSLQRKKKCLRYLTKRPDPNKPLERTLYESVSKEDRIHCYLNPFGTTTGRNAPPSSIFIFAQSSWERILVKTKKEKVIIGLDYAGQEILIGALLTQDENMFQDYHSGDPYTNFAVGSELLPTEDLIAYKKGEVTLKDLKIKHSSFRDTILKPVCLGMAYGLGKVRIAKNINRSEKEAAAIYNAHKTRYKQYWKDTGKFVEYMQKSGDYFSLGGDWGVYEAEKYTTLVNWRIQAKGGEVLRKLAVKLTQPSYRNRDIQLICLLHDAIYLEVDRGTEQEIAEEIEKLMVEVFHQVLPSEKKIRIEYKFHYAEEWWIEPKAVKTWENIKKYISE